MNYNTIVTPEQGLKCTEEEAKAISELLADDSEVATKLEDGTTIMSDGGMHGFEFTYEGGEGYLEAPENGMWDDLPDAVLDKIGALITKNGLPYLEFGAAFTGSRLVPGSTGGTAFRIYPDGHIVNRTETWETTETK